MRLLKLEVNVVIEIRYKVLLIVSRKCNTVAWTTEPFGVKAASSYHQNMVLNTFFAGSRLYVGFGNAFHLATPYLISNMAILPYHAANLLLCPYSYPENPAAAGTAKGIGWLLEHGKVTDQRASNPIVDTLVRLL